MSSAGFILTGGASSRMGTDKALLPWHGRTLLEHTASKLASVTPILRIIGPPDRYAHLRLEVVGDLRPGIGPLGGIETALALGLAEWNLIVACDMPNLPVETLTLILQEAARRQADCLLPRSPGGHLEPLCAVWRNSCLDSVRKAIDRGVRKLTDAVGGLQVVHFEIDTLAPWANLNTPADWREHVPGTGKPPL